MLGDEVPTFWLQLILVTNNPVVCAKFFRLYMDAFLKTLLGFDKVTSEPHVGILGRVAAYYGCVEAQGRGSLHCHMLVWLVGSLNPNNIKERLTCGNDTVFKDNLFAFLEDLIVMSIPDDPLPKQGDPSSLFHPSSVRAPNLDVASDLACKRLQKDLHFLAKACQVCQHTHPHMFQVLAETTRAKRECRFGLDLQNYVPPSIKCG